jgi:lipoate-protein ligase B
VGGQASNLPPDLGERLPWQVLDLGLTPYGEALDRQLALLDLRIRDRIPDTLILVEHPAVVTLGRAKTTANLRATREELRARGVDFFEVSRGGDATYHGPGQLVGYPVFDLRQHGRDVLRFCRKVEAALIATLVGLPALRFSSLAILAGVPLLLRRDLEAAGSPPWWRGAGR